MLPSIFRENLFDDVFDDAFDVFPAFGRRNFFGKQGQNIMKTDVRETDDSYELDIDLPGFKKEELQAKIENGYLTISANKSADKDKKDKKGRYIRQERYVGQFSRSFYVGNSVQREDIQARFEDGILKLSIPKKENKQLPEQNLIDID